MIVTRFSIHVYKSTENNNNVSLRLSVMYSRKRVVLSTGISLPADKWDERKETFVKGAKINGVPCSILMKEINRQREFVENFFSDCFDREVMPDLATLKDQFSKKFNLGLNELTESFWSVWDEYINMRKDGWSETYYKHWLCVKRYLQEFNPQLSFETLTDHQIKKLVDFLKNVKHQGNARVKKSIEPIKEVFAYAGKKKYKVCRDIFEYKFILPEKAGLPRALTYDDLRRIIEVKLDTAVLQRTRDLFLFQCFTSLRYSDLTSLRPSSFVEENNNVYLNIITQKTKAVVKFPLQIIPRRIYEKYKEYHYSSGRFFPTTSLAKYNINLKKLGKAAALTGEWIEARFDHGRVDAAIPKTNLTSHVGRRTFITLAIMQGLTDKQVALITSHTEYEAMKRYVAVNQFGQENVRKTMDDTTRQLILPEDWGD